MKQYDFACFYWNDSPNGENEFKDFSTEHSVYIPGHSQGLLGNLIQSYSRQGWQLVYCRETTYGCEVWFQREVTP